MRRGPNPTRPAVPSSKPATFLTVCPMPMTDDIDWQSWGVTPEAMAQDYQEKPVKLRKLIATRALVIRKRVRAFIEDPDQDPDPDGDDKELLGELPTDCP